MAILFAAHFSWATDLDTIGVTLLRQIDPMLNGNGIRVAQVEGPESTNQPPPFEVDPSVVGRAAAAFTYYSDLGTANTFPNSIGAASGHAGSVAYYFYGIPNGVATNTSHMDNYEANYFYNNIIDQVIPPTIPATIVNQSFIFDTNDAPTVNPAYDNYAARYYGTLFINGVGNGGITPVSPPATAYNCIGVGVIGASSSFGPTVDGRCKPDLVAPGGVTSYSTAYVSGSAAVLAQAAERGDAGTNNASAAGDARTLKALILNGAIKPAGWTNGNSAPLDARYGAGVLNVFNSWQQLVSGRHTFIEATSGSPHPPGGNPNNVPSLKGWDFASLTNSGIPLNYQDRVNHYYFDLTPADGTFTLTTTLVWNKRRNETAINDLNLFLYDTATSNLITCSTSAVDNIEHIFIPALPPGRYDLQVEKNPAAVVTADETYALSFEFFNLRLQIVRSNGNVVLSWPVLPAGFTLQSTTSLAPTSWVTVNASVSVSSNLNVVTLPASGAQQFFRLKRP